MFYAKLILMFICAQVALCVPQGSEMCVPPRVRTDISFERRGENGEKLAIRCVNPTCTPGKECPAYMCAPFTPVPRP
jgi:hypothetical protein